ncbi:antitoxin MazE-like protein [Staphylococcus aureus]
MRAYVERRRERAFAAEARRQSRVLAAAASDPNGEEAEIMRWIEQVADTDGWKA